MQPHASFGEVCFIPGIKFQVCFFLKKMKGFSLVTNLELKPFLIHGNDHFNGMTGHRPIGMFNRVIYRLDNGQFYLINDDVAESQLGTDSVDSVADHVDLIEAAVNTDTDANILF